MHGLVSQFDAPRSEEQEELYNELISVARAGSYLSIDKDRKQIAYLKAIARVHNATAAAIVLACSVGIGFLVSRWF